MAGKAKPVTIEAVQSYISVYAAGMYCKNNKIIPCYWIDGEIKELPMPAGESVCNISSMAVKENSVYLAGTWGNTKNGTKYG